MLAEIGESAELTSTWLHLLSKRCRTVFKDRRLQVRRSPTVHEVDWITGLGGQLFPVPACHVGTTTWDLDAYTPTDKPANCARCLGNGKARAVRRSAVPPPGQLALDLDVPF